MPPISPELDTRLQLMAFSAAMRQQGVCIIHQDQAHRFDLAENIPDIWPDHDILGRHAADILPAALAAQYSQHVERVSLTGEEQTWEFELGDGLRRRIFEARLQRGGADGVLSVITDVTDARERDAAVSALLREVSHRSKNLLAIVQSVAMQTAHHTASVDDFLDKFRGRLHALSSTQDLVTESNWRGTHLHALIAAQLARVGASRLAQVRVTGENPLLVPNASLHLGLAIHELGVNAALHGALAEDQEGEVLVHARLVNQPGDQPELIVEWQETAPASSEIRPARFGSLVLERIVPLSVGGHADYAVEPGKVRYRLAIPSGQFEV